MGWKDLKWEFDVKDVVTEPDIGSNPSDDNMIAVLRITATIR
jgi:hypothetical protein